MTINENETIIVLRTEIGVSALKAGMSCSDKNLHKENTNKNNNENISSD